MTYDLAAAFRYHLQHGKRAVSAISAARFDRDAGKARYPNPVKPYAPATRQEDGKVHLTAEAAADLRGHKVHEMEDSPVDHTGWYTDPYHDVFKDGTGLCYGVVYQLPARAGSPCYVAGYELGGYDGGPTLDLSRLYGEPRDAIRAADHMAEHAADEEREYQAAWQAGRLYHDKGEELATARAELREVLRERRAARGTDAFPALCKALYGHICGMIHGIAELQRERTALKHGNAHEYLSFYANRQTVAAFNDGAEADVLTFWRDQ